MEEDLCCFSLDPLAPERRWYFAAPSPAQFINGITDCERIGEFPQEKTIDFKFVILRRLYAQQRVATLRIPFKFT